MVIGKRAYELTDDDDPLDYVAGFTVANDLSERTFQIEESGGQWSKGKCVPGSTPIGPWLVTTDEVDHRNLRLRSWVNGEPRQDSSTADLIFDCPTIIRHLSQYLALEAGDVVLTGTPEGVALSGRFPYLQPGDVVGIEIEGLGRADASRWSRRGGRIARERRLRRAGRRWSPAAPPGSVPRSPPSCCAAARRWPCWTCRPTRSPPRRSGSPATWPTTPRCGPRSQGVVDRFGRLDIVVNNAGIGAQGTVADNADDEWHRVFDINVVGMVRVSPGRAAAPAPLARPRRSSTPARSPPPPACPQRALYSATKGAVLSLTQAMAADHLREGIRVNCVNPGTADTPWVGRLLDARPIRRPSGRRWRPASRTAGWSRAEEVAGAVAYLASPRSGSTTGIALAVDGGMQALRLRPPGQ